MTRALRFNRNGRVSDSNHSVFRLASMTHINARKAFQMNEQTYTDTLQPPPPWGRYLNTEFKMIKMICPL